MLKHSNNYRIYEIDQDLIDFLRGDGKYAYRSSNDVDKQIYSHRGEINKHSDKYIGIIIEFQNQFYFAPLTHDGDKKWLQRDDTYDIEIIYGRKNEYAGALLLCKALPLTDNLVKYKSLKNIRETEGIEYAYLCNIELEYLNSKEIHSKIQDKMQACVYGKQSSCQEFRINYNLVIENVKQYNNLINSNKQQI